MSLEYSLDLPKNLTMQTALKEVLGLLKKGYKSDHSKNILDARSMLSKFERIVTPDIKDAGKYIGENYIIKITLDIENKARLGGSVLAKLYNIENVENPDIDSDDLDNLVSLINELIEKELIRSYKVINDGGVIVSLCYMSILADSGLNAHLLSYDFYNQAFNEEIGIILEVDRKKYVDFVTVIHNYYCRKSHPFPGISSSAIEPKHHYFNVHSLGLTQKEKTIDIWWGLNCKMNICESTDNIRRWF
jgi:hypothetical protein